MVNKNRTTNYPENTDDNYIRPITRIEPTITRFSPSAAQNNYAYKTSPDSKELKIHDTQNRKILHNQSEKLPPPGILRSQQDSGNSTYLHGNTGRGFRRN